MNTKILTLLTIFALLVAIVPAMAYNQTDPAGFTVNFVTQASTTTFSVVTNTVQLNFSSFSGAGIVSPEGGNVWGSITNVANQALNFSVKLDNLSTGITLKMGSSDGSTGSGTIGYFNDLINVSTTAASPKGWTNVPYTGSTTVSIVAQADYGVPSPGTDSKQITIASASAAP